MLNVSDCSDNPTVYYIIVVSYDIKGGATRSRLSQKNTSEE